MREIAVEESPLIPLSHSVTIILAKGYVENFKPQSFGGHTYKYTKINNEKKLVINKK
jgi:ABC-type transport system substrate-binding protein